MRQLHSEFGEEREIQVHRSLPRLKDSLHALGIRLLQKYLDPLLQPFQLLLTHIQSDRRHLRAILVLVVELLYHFQQNESFYRIFYGVHGN